MDTDVKDGVETAAPQAKEKMPAATPTPERTPRGKGDRRHGRGRGPRKERPERKSEYDQKILTIRRVSRTVAGGRRFNFSVAIIIGNKKGKVGVGTGKAGDTSLAIDKAVRSAKKHMITLKLTKDSSIGHDVYAKYSASRVELMPSPGRGLVAGSSVRPVLELAGVTNLVAKVRSGSKNRLNNAQATIEALKTLKD